MLERGEEKVWEALRSVALGVTMKKPSRTAARKVGKGKRKPIMRHSREGVKGRKAKRAAKAKRTVKARSGAKRVVRKAKPAEAKGTVGKWPAEFTRRRRSELSLESLSDARAMGEEFGIQSGDMEGLSRLEDADSESVEELVEEGQAFEAGVISGVEEADGKPGEVRTRGSSRGRRAS
jgi:hypothetical protein